MTEKRRHTERAHEIAMVRAFVRRERQARWLELLGNPERRRDATAELAHFKHLDSSCLQEIPSSRQSAPGILAILKAKGAPAVCHVISEAEDLDGKEVDLAFALKQIVGHGMGTLLSCIPGRLAYFEDEDHRFVLEPSSLKAEAKGS